MKRRQVITLLGSAALVWPRAGLGQQPGRVHRLAILLVVNNPNDLFLKTFLDELRRFGYVEGRNLIVDTRSADGDAQRLPAIARELVALKPDIIWSVANRPTEAFKTATTTIPIVAVVADPIGSGFAGSLAKPGGNITGFTIDAGLEIIGKNIELLKQAAPTASRIAYLTPRRFLDSQFAENFRIAAKRAGMMPIDAPLNSPVNEAEIRRAFLSLKQAHADSVWVGPTPETYFHARLIAELASEARIVSIGVWKEFANAGGFMAYAVDLVEISRRGADYIDRILKGARPAELPFQQPTKFELIVNLRTAKLLGLAVPEAILARADEVID